MAILKHTAPKLPELSPGLKRQDSLDVAGMAKRLSRLCTKRRGLAGRHVPTGPIDEKAPGYTAARCDLYRTLTSSEGHQRAGRTGGF